VETAAPQVQTGIDVHLLTEEVRQSSAFLDEVFGQVGRVVVGQREMVERVMIGLLTGGHCLIEGVPGLAKTLTVKTLSQTINASFQRIQFTPDLLPADITGTIIYNMHTGQFTQKRGPLFANLVLADEVNRAPAKVQSALLEAMQERQITVEGETFPLPEPFCVFATANPIEYEGTYPLPEAQLDRFLMRVGFGYPSSDEEYDVLERRVERRREEIMLDALTDSGGVLAMQEAVESVRLDESVGRYCVALAAATRDHREVLTGSSPRGSLGLVLAARAFALIRGRDYVIPEDVKVVARPVLAHRITIRPELWMTQSSGRTVVDDVLTDVATPSTLEHTK
jgi:MoxR-like ATPase